MLGKQWNAESEEVKAHYKVLADDIKRKHAKEHPGYQYAPRKPSEKKRRISSRQFQNDRKPSVSALPDSPASSTTAPSSNVTTPIPLHPAVAERLRTVEMNESMADLAHMNLAISQNEAMGDVTLDFDSDAFNVLIQQIHNEQEKAMLSQQFGSMNHQTTAETFNFSDFITDCY